MAIVEDAKYESPVAEKEFVDVALSASRFIMEAFTIAALVVVELPTIRSVIEARVATSDEIKELVVVELLTTAFVVVELLTTRLVMLARVATSDEMKELVEVELVDVELFDINPEKLPFVALKLVVKKFVELLLVVEAFVAVKLVVVAFVILALVP